MRLQTGERVGEYEIVGFLGAGGMGSVYHGIHKRINRSAAIKVLSAASGSSNFTERFFNEARLQSSLHHPNIATLYDFQESGGTLFIVMEYVDGETLDALISRRYFAVEDALSTFGSICDAVAFIHGNKIVHRDIKPQNIKLSSTGMIKLLDFGIAKGDISRGLTRVGGVIGTPGYLAPEQLAGKPATPASDIWSLGVLFYEMLTGTEPFKGKTIGELYLQITSGRYVEPGTLNPAIPVEVTRIVNKCLAVEPDQRYQSASEILSDVQTALRRYHPEPIAQGRKHFALGRRNSPQTGEKENPSNTNLDGSHAGIAENRKMFSRLAVGIAACTGIFVIVSIGIWALSGSAETGSANSVIEPAQGPVRIASANPTAPSVERLTAQQSGSKLETSIRPRVRVEVVEGVAEVFRDGQPLGTTPIDLEGAENESVDLLLRRAGFIDLPVTIDLTTRRKVYTFTLRRKQ